MGGNPIIIQLHKILGGLREYQKYIWTSKNIFNHIRKWLRNYKANNNSL